MFYLFATLLAFYLTVLTVPLANRIAGKLGAVDRPDGGRKMHAAPTPRTGGIALMLGILIPAWLWAPLDPGIKAFLSGIAVIYAFGFLDDLLTLNYRKKLAGQLTAVVAAMAMGRLYISDLGMWGGHEILLGPWIGIPFTVLFLLGITNAVNLADGLDGLAGGLCLLSFGGMAVLAHMEGHFAIAVCSLIFVGALLGFLRYNTFPASVFMGDGGSQVLGFSLGILSVILTQEPHSGLSRTLPLLLIGFPILDMIFVMGERILDGKSPFQSDTRHFHYRLVHMGASPVGSVVVIYAIQAGLVILALYLRRYPEDWILAVYLAVAVPVLGFIWLSARFGLSIPRFLSWGADWGSGGKFARPARWVSAGSLWGIRVLLPLGLVWLALSCPSSNGHVAESIIFLAMAVLLPVIYGLARPLFSILVRLSLYTAGFFLLVHTRGERMEFLDVPVRIFNRFFWGTLAALLVLYFIGDRFRRFQASTLDYLLLLLVVLIPILPLEQLHRYQIGTVAGGMIVLLWTTEAVIRNQKRSWNASTLAALACLVIIGLSGL